MFKGKLLLVVDDEQDLREILRDEFVAEFADVDEAKNGKDALAKLKSRQYDAVLSDIRMPGGDGVTLAKEIKGMGASRPVVFLITGFADIKSWEAYDLGAEGFVTKPFHLDALRENVARVLTPAEERWATALGIEPNQKIVVEDNFASAFEKKLVNIGRGGIFVRSSARTMKLGEVVRVQIGSDYLDGVVRWSRGENQNALPAGCGLEILFVNEPLRKEIVQVLNKEQPRSFIPQQ